MNNQVLDTQLNLAFDATLEELKKSQDLDVGYDGQTGQWEAIVRYAGAGQDVADRRPSEIQGLSVTWLSGGYGIIRGTKAAIDAFSEDPFVEYVEKPKRLYFATEQGKLASCMEPLQTDFGFSLFGKGILIAVLEKHLGMFFGTLDVYLNVVGGFQLDEPAGDLAVALCLFSSLTDKPISEKTVAFGEVGLGGEVRAIAHIRRRVQEAERMGFTRCIVPWQCLHELKGGSYQIRIAGVRNLRQAFSVLEKDAREAMEKETQTQSAE